MTNVGKRNPTLGWAGGRWVEQLQWGTLGPKQPPKSFGCPLVRAMTWGGPVRVSLLSFSLLPAWVEVVLWQTGPNLLQDRDLSLHP